MNSSTPSTSAASMGHSEIEPAANKSLQAYYPEASGRCRSAYGMDTKIESERIKNSGSKAVVDQDGPKRAGSEHHSVARTREAPESLNRIRNKKDGVASATIG